MSSRKKYKWDVEQKYLISNNCYKVSILNIYTYT